MKKNWCIYILLIMLGLTTIPACDDDDEDPAATYKDWKEQNEAFIEQLKYNTDYESIESASKMGSIRVKKLVTGEGTRRIMFTDTIMAYYEGSLINDSIFETYMPPYEASRQIVVKNMLDGFTTALQHMKVGDRWDVWMPWELGYGVSGFGWNKNTQTGIRPYSALHFIIEVTEIVNER